MDNIINFIEIIWPKVHSNLFLLKVSLINIFNFENTTVFETLGQDETALFIVVIISTHFFVVYN